MTAELNMISNSEVQTIKIGEELGKLLKPGSIIALRGELGSGKTVLVKGIARGLDVKEEPNSPTFVIMNAYRGRIPLYHFDLYRISGKEELEEIGYEDFFFGDGVTVVEWADRVEEVFPEDTIKIEITIPERRVETQNLASLHDEDPNVRKIKVEGENKWLLSFRSSVELVSPTLTR